MQLNPSVCFSIEAEAGQKTLTSFGPEQKSALRMRAGAKSTFWAILLTTIVNCSAVVLAASAAAFISSVVSKLFVGAGFETRVAAGLAGVSELRWAG